MAAATLPKTLVQFGLSPANLCSASTLPRTLFTNLFMLSTDPWSQGHHGWPVTVRTLGFMLQRNVRIDLAVNSFPLSVWNIFGYPIVPNISCSLYATRFGCFHDRAHKWISPVAWSFIVMTQCIKTPKGSCFLSFLKSTRSIWNLSQKDLERIGFWLPFSILVTGFFFMHVRQVLQ